MISLFPPWPLALTFLVSCIVLAGNLGNAVAASVEADAPVEAAPLRRVFRDGFVIALFNPKTAVFFAAFLPQFITPGTSPMAQSLLLGTAFVSIAALSDSGYALAASAVAPRLAASDRARRAGAWLGGGTYLGLGIVTALGGGRTAR